MRRLFVRIPAAALMVLGALCVAAGASWSWWQPLAVQRAAEGFERDTGITIHVAGVRPTIGGMIHVRSLRAGRGTLAAECHDVDVQLRVSTALRGTVHVRSLRIGRCEVAGGDPLADSGAGDATATHDSPRVPSPAPALRTLDALTAHVDTIAIGSLRVAHPVGQLAVQDLVVALEPALRASGTLRADVRGRQTADLRFVVSRDGGRLVASLPSPLAIGGVRVGATALQWGDDGLLAYGAAVTIGETPVGSIDAFALSGTAACPRLRVTGAHVDVPDAWLPARLRRTDAAAAMPNATTPAAGPAPELHEQDEPPEANDAPAWEGESPGQRWLRRGGELARQVDAWIGAMPTERCFELDLRDSRFDAGRVEGTVRSASRRQDGLLRADGRVGNLEVRLDADGRRLEWAELAVSGIDLSRMLGGHTGERTAGEVELGGRLTRLPGRELRFRGAVTFRDAGLQHAAISPEPLTGIHAGLSVDARARIHGDVGVDLVAYGAVGEVPVSADVRLEPTDTTHRVTIDAGTLGPVPCQSIWEAVPAGLVPNLTHEGVTFSGLASPRLQLQYDLAAPDTFALTAGAFLAPCTVVDVRREYDPRQLNSDSYVHHVTEGVTVDDVFVGPGSDSWVPIAAVPGYLPAAMYLSEEINFFGNPGVAVGLINRGMRLNLERMRYAYGGSTVTQQLVKNLFLSRSKTLSRKLEEAVLAMALEQWVSKFRILELYMNCIEFGPNVYGVGRAARYYFGVEAAELTPLEAVFLANLKPSPLSGARHLLRGATPDTGWWPERTALILQRLVDHGGFIEPEEVSYWAPWVVALPGESGADARRPRPPWLSPKDRRSIHDILSTLDLAP